MIVLFECWLRGFMIPASPWEMLQAMKMKVYELPQNFYQHIMLMRQLFKK